MAVSLDQIQPIISFTPSCTRVYTSDISGCTAGDFTNRGSCSPECVEGLETLSRSLNIACVGTRAFSGSLIGLFFRGLGVETLCPNGGGGGGGGEIESPTRANPSDTPPTTETRRPRPTQTQTEDPSTPTPSPTRRPTTSTTTTRSASTTSDSYVTPSPPPSTTTSDSTTTRTTLEPSTTRASDPENDPFGGFGNAFDIIAPNRAASTSQSRKIGIGIAGAAVLFTIQLAWQ
ncbi:hypothetical protein EMCG_03792 [[Emmonsia] crescens]|uniref:Uncharacterized protein n=1 Tax=[Emmonsia] crescens TaxID=73230 RepID=A0A0G2HUE5_9EURO|nr:hypothetical protein EMCG_03792 [Emmonsia crescens UAMH 3008]